MESRARSQSNLVVRQVSYFPRVKRFSNLIIPMFWAEYVSWIISSLQHNKEAFLNGESTSFFQ